MIMREHKNAHPRLQTQVRTALEKAVDIVADGNGGFAAFGAMMVAWVVLMAVYACVW